jgi:pSer/pThr/pTyr-binding forkhead associated (FHA) protein
MITIMTDEGEFTNGQTLVVGRSLNCNFVTPKENETVSRVHLRIQISPQGEIFVQDEGSFNGTFVNGVQLDPFEPIELDPMHDTLLIGSHLLDFQQIDEDESFAVYELLFRPAGHR